MTISNLILMLLFFICGIIYEQDRNGTIGKE